MPVFHRWNPKPSGSSVCIQSEALWAPEINSSATAPQAFSLGVPVGTLPLLQAGIGWTRVFLHILGYPGCWKSCLSFKKYLFIYLAVLGLNCCLQGLQGLQLCCWMWDWLPDQGWNPVPLHWERGVLATGPPGKPYKTFSFGTFLQILPARAMIFWLKYVFPTFSLPNPRGLPGLGSCKWKKCLHFTLILECEF